MTKFWLEYQLIEISHRSMRIMQWTSGYKQYKMGAVSGDIRHNVDKGEPFPGAARRDLCPNAWKYLTGGQSLGYNDITSRQAAPVPFPPAAPGNTPGAAGPADLSGDFPKTPGMEK